MTNTLHRQGTRESLKSDFIIFATPARGYNREGCAEKLKEFLSICLRHNPVNLGNMYEGNIYSISPQKIIEEITDSSSAAAVFSDPDTLRKVVAEVKEADLGISINISGLLDEVEECCRSVGITRHSVEHSLGVKGQIARLPERRVLEISTMCGHGMVSFDLVRRMIDYVKQGKLKPKKAAPYLAKPCVCGAFNPKRAEELLEKAKAAK